MRVGGKLSIVAGKIKKINEIFDLCNLKSSYCNHLLYIFKFDI